MEISDVGIGLVRQYLSVVNRGESSRPSPQDIFAAMAKVVPFSAYGVLLFSHASKGAPLIFSNNPDPFKYFFARCLELRCCPPSPRRDIRLFPVPLIGTPAGCIAFGRPADGEPGFSPEEENLLHLLVSWLPLPFLESLRTSPSLSTVAMVKYGLSPKEREIVVSLRQGLSNAEIGRSLKISERTVKRHLYNIYNKTGMDSRMRLLRLLSAEFAHDHP